MNLRPFPETEPEAWLAQGATSIRRGQRVRLPNGRTSQVRYVNGNRLALANNRFVNAGVVKVVQCDP